MLYNWGRLMVRLRWWVIGLWVAVLLASLPIAPRAASALKSGFGEVETESRVALKLLDEKLGVTESSITLVFASDALHALDPTYVESVERAIAPVRALPHVDSILTYYDGGDSTMVSPDGRTTYALVLLDTDIDTSVELVPDVRAAVESGDLQVWATGGIAIFSDINQASERDLRRAEAITLPVVLIALLIIFGGIVAAGLPMLMGVVSVAMTLALVYLLALRVDMSIFVLNIATFLGLGMAVDYSLLTVSRFREEVGDHDIHDAVAITCATAGKAILFSAATSIIGLSGLLFFKFMMLRSLGIGGVTVILFSMLIALSLLPALLAVLGQRVNALSIVPRRAADGRFWGRIAGWVMRHPVAVVVPVAAGLLLLGAPFFGVKLGTPWASILPSEAEARQGWEVVEERFGPGELAPFIAVLTSETGVLSPENVGAAYDFAQRLISDPRVVRVSSIVTADQAMTRSEYQRLYATPSEAPPELRRVLDELTSPEGDASVMRIFTAHSPTADESKALVTEIRSSPVGGDLEMFLTGATPDLMDTVDWMYADVLKVLTYVAVATYLALMLLFRSVVLPLKAVVLNFMSIFASFGALVFVFQQGHFQQLLGFTSEGFTEASVPIILFAIVFGLSMDYEVFLLSRVKEEYDATGDNTASVARGMERSGRVITSAALILVLVASGFATGDILIVKTLGFGTALAIFIDATIVRALLVPSLMRILSDLNWWAPRFMRGAPGLRKSPLP